MKPYPATGTRIFTLQAQESSDLLRVDTVAVMQALRESGAVLLRGFSTSLSGFQQFTEKFCDRFHQVGTRRAVDDRNSDGHTSEVPRRNFNLFVHSEGTYRPNPPPPELCFFNCVLPAATGGGETLLADGVHFLGMLPDDLCQRFEQQGIIYQALWDTARWQTEFQLQRREQLNEFLRKFPGCSYRMQDDEIAIRCRVAAIQTSLGGLPAFANGLLAHLPAITHPRWQNTLTYSKSTNRIFFGDGEEIGTAVIDSLIDIQDEIALAHSWQADDLLILDNKRFMHGRLMTKGDCERQIRSRFGQLGPEFSKRPGKQT